MVAKKEKLKNKNLTILSPYPRNLKTKNKLNDDILFFLKKIFVNLDSDMDGKISPSHINLKIKNLELIKEVLF